MIDFHNHILPGADDGAKNMQESIAMLHFAQEQGITDVVNTVHFQHPKMEGKRTDFDYISSLKDKLLEEMSRENININIHLGAEVFFNFNLLDILDNPLITFCNGKYMLIEFQTFMMPKGYEKHLYDLKISGVTPIIAHPERYKPIQDDISIVEKLINSGCIIQIDAGSILGHFGKNCKIASEAMIRRNMVHIIGSDSHGTGKRNFCLKQAVDILKTQISEDILDIILYNPNNIISGKKIIPFEFIEDPKSSFYKRISSFFKR
jgi:protein-tyrosine phosphatase